MAAVIHGTCSDRLLDSYGPERSAVGDAVLKAADRLTTVATLRNPIAQGARNLVAHLVLGLGPVQHAVAETITELATGYRESPLNGQALPGAGPRPGARLPPTEAQAPPGTGATPRFALFAQPGIAVDELIGAFPDLLEPAPRPPLRADTLWLVRPDGYVACSATDTAAIAVYLRRITPGSGPEA